MSQFILPRTIYHGLGSLENISKLKGKKAVIVSGKSVMRKLGYIQKTQAYLKKASIESALFEGVEEDPSMETVMKGTDFMNKEKPDIIIGLGGGSAIDAAKAMWIFYEHPKATLQDILEPFSIPELRNKAIFIAIPSTSGTGTEVTCVSVITERKKGVKYPLVSYEITPDIAVIDAELCKSMPPSVTANTGLDALTHSTETFVSTLANPYTESMAIKSIKMIFDNLPKVYRKKDDLEARQAMHDAATLAGMAFSNSLLGIVHAMAHQLGGMFAVPHGRANIILLPNAIRYNSKSTDRYNLLAKLFNKSNAEDYAKEIEKLRGNVEVESCLKDWGLEEKVFQEKLDEITKNAMKDPCVGANPRKPTFDEIKKIYEYCYYGKKVDF